LTDAAPTASPHPAPTDRRLTWALAIVTRHRFDILKIALRLGVTQSRPPGQVIVVDTSNDWQRCRDEVMRDIRPLLPSAEWVYLRGDVPSITVQRNQAIERLSTDVVFFFDDDTLMHEGCAEAIMRVYEGDPGAAMAGLGATEVRDVPPAASELPRAKAQHGRDSRFQHTALFRFFKNEVILNFAERRIIPWGPPFSRGPLPASLARFNLVQRALLFGYQMTWRTAVCRAERFEPALRSYAACEDLDFSYRATRHGLLANVPDARVYHHAALSGRDGERVRVAMQIMNAALFCRRNAEDLPRARAAWRTLTLRRVPGGLIKDAMLRDRRLPGFFGALDGLRHGRAVFAMPRDRLDAEFPELQARVLRLNVTPPPPEAAP